MIKKRRKILCVFPRYTKAFGTFHHAFQFFPDTLAFMPPQGILTICAYLPKDWDVRFMDENVGLPTDEDYRWADCVLVSGMHVQKEHMNNIAAHAHEFGKLAVVGGPSPSSAPEYYPNFDIVHQGELGDATDALIRYIDVTIERPEKQIVLKTEVRLPLDDFPIPAFDLIDFNHYFLVNIQWSSGCPYTCEFCDIPELYGRNPRMKSPERILKELDAILAKDPIGAIYFVDDNLIGNKKEFKKLLPHLIEWQKRNGYRLKLGGECTLNVAQDTEILEGMREANFIQLFFGIESPDVTTIASIDKDQNLRMPIVDAVKIINSYGIELFAGFILGLDNDGPDTADKIIKFVQETNIPMLAINVIYALPQTPLWRRLEKEGRLIPTESVQESNVVFKLPAAEVIEQWRKVVTTCFAPEALHERFRHNILHTYTKRKKAPLNRYSLTLPMLRIAVFSLSTIFLRLGINGTYKPAFWRMARALVKKGHIDHLVYVAAFGHHLIKFAEDVRDGEVKACFYTERVVETPLIKRFKVRSAARRVLRLRMLDADRRRVNP